MERKKEQKINFSLPIFLLISSLFYTLYTHSFLYFLFFFSFFSLTLTKYYLAALANTSIIYKYK